MVGLVSSSFVRHIEWFFVTYGLITGTGLGLILGPTMVFPGMYFNKKLRLALGLNAAGSGLGSFVLPNLMRLLLDTYGLSGCLLVMGGIMLHTCLFALLLRPPSFWRCSLHITKDSEDKTEIREEKEGLLAHQRGPDKANTGITHIPEMALPRTRSLPKEFGFTDSQGALCVSIVGLADFFGRGGSGMIGNLCFREMRNLYIISVVLFSCFTVVITFMRTFVVFIVICGLLGLSTGGYIGAQLAMVAEELGKDNLSTAWGYIAFVSSFSILIDPVISGAIRDYTGSWTNSFTMAAVCGFVSAK
ncbi:monocarboxylate transporter 12-B-like [Crassostrea virginica]